LNNICCIN